MRREVTFIYLAVIGTASLLYRLREIPWIGRNLFWTIALILFCVPIAHNRLRRLSLSFFESNSRQTVHSLKIFAATSLLVFPGFLLANHFYQQVVFNASFYPDLPNRFFSRLITQLVLIALPEEIFFRGWLQTLIRRTFSPFKAIALASLVFAFSHSLIAMQWWHFAIFFPGCVFGWLKEKTGAVTASVLFHTVSNLLVAWIASSYSWN